VPEFKAVTYGHHFAGIYHFGFANRNTLNLA
jgi:hypothetical protein